MKLVRLPPPRETTPRERLIAVLVACAIGAAAVAAARAYHRPEAPRTHSRLLRGLFVLLVLAVTHGAARADQLVPPATALPRVLTLDDALRIFRTAGLNLLIAEASIENAEGQVLAADAIPNPQLSASVGNALTYSTSAASQQNCLANGARCSPWVNAIGITDSAALGDTLSGKRDLRARVARTALAAVKLSRRDAERSLELQVKSAYAQVAQAVLAARFAKEIAATNVETLKKFQDLQRLGARSEAELERIEVQKLESDQAVDAAVQQLRAAKLALAFLLGVRGAVPDFDVDPRVLDYRVPAALAKPDEAELLRIAFAHRPDLLALGYSKESAAAQIALVHRERFPDVTLGAAYGWGGFGGFSTNGPISGQTLTFSLSLPIPVFYQLDGELHQASAQYKTTSLQEAKATAQVANDIEAALALLELEKKLVERMEGPRRDGGGLLESAHGAYIHTAQLFYGGSSTLADLLDAYRQWIATQNEYFGDLQAYWTAVFQLEAAVGRELR